MSKNEWSTADIIIAVLCGLIAAAVVVKYM